MNNHSIALIGLSGTGKSTVGRELATRSNMLLVDIDMQIEARAGQPIPAIFSQHGEPGFRDIETEALKDALASGQPCVLATGAGIVLRPENRALLRQHAFVVWLDAPTDMLVARLQAHDEERPLLRGEDMAARLEALRAARVALYTEVAHVRVDTSEHSAGEVAKNILLMLEEPLIR